MPRGGVLQYIRFSFYTWPLILLTSISSLWIGELRTRPRGLHSSGPHPPTHNGCGPSPTVSHPPSPLLSAWVATTKLGTRSPGLSTQPEKKFPACRVELIHPCVLSTCQHVNSKNDPQVKECQEIRGKDAKWHILKIKFLYYSIFLNKNYIYLRRLRWWFQIQTTIYKVDKQQGPTV